jgi:hypothetical protein
MDNPREKTNNWYLFMYEQYHKYRDENIAELYNVLKRRGITTKRKRYVIYNAGPVRRPRFSLMEVEDKARFAGIAVRRYAKASMEILEQELLALNAYSENLYLQRQEKVKAIGNADSSVSTEETPTGD